MHPYSVLVFVFCIIGAVFSDQDNSVFLTDSVRDVINIYNECKTSDGLMPCLKLKALDLVDRVGRMDTITFMDGIELKGKTTLEEKQPSIEEVEKTLPRSIDAKSQALTEMIIDRVARTLGSKTLEISLPKVVESGRKKGDEDGKFGDLDDLFGGGGGGHGHGGGGHGGGHGGGGGKKKGKKGGNGMKEFLMQVMAHKIAMIPLLIAGLFVLALKALINAKIALLIAGIIFAKKLMSKQSSGGDTQHVSAGWSGASSGGDGGWSASSSGGHGGGGWGSGGWDRRSITEAQKLAYKAQRPE